MFSPAQIATEVEMVVGMLEGVVPQLGLSANTTTGISNALEDVRLATDAFAKADNAATAAPLIDRIGADLNGVLSTLASAPLPSAAVIPVRIASILVPVIIGAADLLFPPTLPKLT